MKPERSLTVEKLEEVVDKHQLLQNDEEHKNELVQPLRAAKYKQFGSDAEPEEEDPVQSPNSLTYGMKDNRSPYVQQQAQQQKRMSVHRKKPTFGAAQLQSIQSEEIQSEAEDEDDEEPEMAPQQFPKMSNVNNYAPSAPGAQMNKDYDPLNGMNEDSNDSNMNEAEG